jgi:hypothetical protein
MKRKDTFQPNSIAAVNRCLIVLQKVGLAVPWLVNGSLEVDRISCMHVVILCGMKARHDRDERTL